MYSLKYSFEPLRCCLLIVGADMQRRELIRQLLGCVAVTVAACGAGAAADVAIPRIGVLIYSNPQTDPNTESFRRGMRDLGYVDGQNIAIEYRYAEGKPERLPELAAELVRLKPDVLFALGGDVTPVVVEATQTIPIVFVVSADPVQSSDGDESGAARRQRHRRHLAARRTRLQAPGAAQGGGAARCPGWRSSSIPITSTTSYAKPSVRRRRSECSFTPPRCEVPAISTMHSMPLREAGVDALYVVSSRHTVLKIARIVAFAAKNRLPLAGGWGAWAQAGGLISYGPNVDEMVRHRPPMWTGSSRARSRLIFRCNSPQASSY